MELPKFTIAKLSKDAHVKVFMRAEYIFLISILLGFLFNIFWPVWIIPKFIRIALGIIFVIASGSIMLLSWELFQKANTPVGLNQPTRSLVMKGPHKYSRNPQYLSRALTQVAIGFFFGNIWIIIMVIPALILVWYSAIIPEERYLEQRFGEKYLQYKASTRCWF